METKTPIRLEEAEKLVEKINEEYGLEKVLSMIQDNKVKFIHKEKKYRVRLLTQNDKDELDLMRRKKYSELLQAKDGQGNPSFLFEKEIIQIYKDRGIANIEETNDEIQKLFSEIKEISLKLGKALEDKDPETILKNYEDQISVINRKIRGIEYQKSILLENSFERTLNHFVVKVCSYLSLEIEENEIYKRAFNSLEEFLKTDEELITMTVSFSLAINHGV